MKAKRLLPLLLAAVMGASVLTGCDSIKEDARGATLDGEEITLGFMNFMARYQQAIYDGSYSSIFGADFWGQDLYGNGSDMETSVKEQVADNIKMFYLLEDHMKDYSVEITKEEIAEIEKAAKAFMEDNTKEAIKQIGATEEYVKEMLRLNTIQKKMKDAIDKEVDTKVSNKEAAQKTFSYVKVSKASTTDEEGNAVTYTDEEKEALKEDMEAYVKKAEKDFDKAAEDKGYTVESYSYGSDEESFAEAVIKEADNMKDGQISGLLQDDENYYVIRMDSTFDKEKTEQKKEEIVDQRKTEHFQEVCDGYAEGVKFEINEKEWGKVKFDSLFTLKQEKEEEEEQPSEEESSDKDSQEKTSGEEKE